MKRFLLSVVWFGVLTAASVAVLATAVLPRIPLDVSWFAATVGQVERRIRDAGDRPRLFLLGGSNLAYGVDDALLEELLEGRFAVINYGAHAGLGVGNLLDLAAPHIREGDVAVICAEYVNYSQWGGEAASLVYQCDLLGRTLLTAGRGPYNAYPWHGVRAYVWEKLKALTADGGRNPTATGGEAPGSEPTAQYRGRAPYRIGSFALSDGARRGLRAFGRHCQACGAQCLVSASVLDARHAALYEEELRKLYGDLERLASESHAYRVISDPWRYAYPLEQMYDTQWHVNALGRLDRTRKLASDIRRALRAWRTRTASSWYNSPAARGKSV